MKNVLIHTLYGLISLIFVVTAPKGISTTWGRGGGVRSKIVAFWGGGNILEGGGEL